MTFTDDDLKRLKEELINDTDRDLYPELHGLVHRLEAAETVMRENGSCCMANLCSHLQRKTTAMMAWRKAAGK